MPVTGIDHVVVTVSDVNAAKAFYDRIPGVEPITYGEGRHALRCGAQKINLHEAGAEIQPRAPEAEPGDGDVCLLTDTPGDQLADELREAGLGIELGPVERTGARGELTSIYVRDPDGNLIEIGTYE